MPGELKPDAVCPKCGDPLQALVDTSDANGVMCVYYHMKNSPRARRRRRCVVTFTDKEAARQERAGLET